MLSIRRAGARPTRRPGPARGPVRALAAAVALSAAASIGAAAVPAAAAPVTAAAPAVAPAVLPAPDAVFVDPSTGQTIATRTRVVSVSPLNSSLKATTLAAVNADPPDPVRGTKCRDLEAYYEIYVVSTDVVLLRWSFEYDWCWYGRTVRSAYASNGLLYKHNAIRMTGSWSQTKTRITPGRYRIVHQGMHFEFCPIGNHLCVGNLDPVMDVALLAEGAYEDNSVV